MPDVMTVENVAKQLGCPSTAPIMRVISRGALKATRLPTDGKFRVVEDVLAAYVQAGTADLAGNPDDQLVTYATAFEKAILKSRYPPAPPDGETDPVQPGFVARHPAVVALQIEMNDLFTLQHGKDWQRDNQSAIQTVTDQLTRVRNAA